jgi:CheY-like chemotaxis protein
MSQPLILIVEDEPLVRLYAVSILEKAGFSTLQAGSAEVAIALLEAGKDIGIVFTDIDLPAGMDGLRLAHTIRHRWPPVEIVLTSGHVQVRDKDMPERGHFLGKPYGSRELVETMRLLLP